MLLASDGKARNSSTLPYPTFTPRNESKPMTTAATLTNPPSVHAPLGLYSHCAALPANAQLLYIAGQVGVRPDGTTPPAIGEQADQVFLNIAEILQASGMGFENIVKLTTFMVMGHSGADVRAARLRHLGDLRPASTAVYVSQLVSPEWFVEIEAVAAKL
jgi:enamine deaminase RidA (YjgF/YER057c/UK114 family)